MLLSHKSPYSTIAAGGLNFCVRNGNRCGPTAIDTGKHDRCFSVLFFYKKQQKEKGMILKKPHDQLVRISSTHCYAYTFRLSTSSSRRGLQDPEGSGKTYLEVGFPLRCFQRLSIPNLATLPCRWRDNRFTRDSSVPVLSY